MELKLKQIKKIINNPTVWKGTPPYEFPVGNTPTIITPKTNKDYTNTQPAPFGKPRPLKHHRLGRVMKENNAYNTTNSYYQQILQKIMDNPSSTVIENNEQGNVDFMYNNNTNIVETQPECYYYSNVPYIVDYKPIVNETQTPNKTTTNKQFCCNEERKAIRRVVGANTNVKENYYLTTNEYLQKKCLTYTQNSYDFYYKNNKTYAYQCRGNLNSNCKQSFYNPNNQVFPVEGSVRNSTYLNKLKSVTISSTVTDDMKQMYQAPQQICLV